MRTGTSTKRASERNHAQRYADGIAPPVSEPPPSPCWTHLAFAGSVALAMRAPLDPSGPPTQKSRGPHLRALHRHGLEHRSDLPVAQRARRGYSEGRGPLGALDGEANVAQPGLSRHGLLREDADSPGSSPPEARNADATDGRCRSASRQCAPRTAARGVDRDPGTGDHRRADLRAGAGTAAREQGARPPPHDRAEPGAGTGELPQVRLRVLAHLDAVDRAQDSVLSLHRVRPVAALGGSTVRCASGPAGPAGRGCVDRSFAVARGAGVDPAGTGSPAGRRPGTTAGGGPSPMRRGGPATPAPRICGWRQIRLRRRSPPGSASERTDAQMSARGRFWRFRNRCL